MTEKNNHIACVMAVIKRKKKVLQVANLVSRFDAIDPSTTTQLF